MNVGSFGLEQLGPSGMDGPKGAGTGLQGALLREGGATVEARGEGERNMYVDNRRPHEAGHQLASICGLKSEERERGGGKGEGERPAVRVIRTARSTNLALLVFCCLI